MIPSSTQKDTPAPPPFGNLSQSHVIDQGQTCRYCGAPVKTLELQFATSYLRCSHCGRYDTDLVVLYLVDKRNNRLASPLFSSTDQVRQYADLFGIRPEDDYGLWEGVCWYGADPQHQERLDQIEILEMNGRVLAWLLENRTSYPGDDGLVQLAVMAQLTGYALPQFRDAAAKGA